MLLAAALVLAGPWPAKGTTSGPRREFVDSIIVHAIGGPSCRGGKLMFSGAPGDAQRWKDFFDRHPFLGIHYVVDREGRVLASTPEDKVANHALENNATSIGIELVHEGEGIEPSGSGRSMPSLGSSSRSAPAMRSPLRTSRAIARSMCAPSCAVVTSTQQKWIQEPISPANFPSQFPLPISPGHACGRQWAISPPLPQSRHVLRNTKQGRWRARGWGATLRVRLWAQPRGNPRSIMRHLCTLSEKKLSARSCFGHKPRAS